MAKPGRLLLALVVIQLVIFIVSLPGFGIETRTPAQYAAWAGPLFLLFTLLIFVLGLAALGLSRSRPAWTRNLAVGQGVVALAINFLDISHVGGPAPPTGPLILGIASIVVALAEIAVVFNRSTGD